ncbi:ferrous-iron efflux pump FieF [Pasteurella langaaensis DSM 22999]|uniref:Cation-efflux pump FieF n=1 Tax=Alitibacter langaaensis DSM 22999 TaxID=1122935 RepID=A0A2U0T6I0_9PAST|nr:cation diffusion facilitator family transporter [Pasteurella langaaensis]PVX39220.1 ferrous-iron efflux pump FieF [Pasteurella langaaensis DSM 22999]
MQQQYQHYVKRAASFAVIVSTSLIIVKGIAWWKTGSLAILAAMTDSLVDLLASGTNMLVLRFALQPADRNHYFGHGKAESLAALAQSAFITGSAVFLLLQGIQRLANPVATENNGFGVIVCVISILLTFALLMYQRKVISLTQSPAIQADKLHYQTDLLMNSAILIAMLFSLYGIVYADAIFAIIIALYIFASALKMSWEAIQTLLDRALPEEEIQQIIQLAEKHPQVIGIHDIGTRQVGNTKFIQLHLELEDHLPLIDAHEIADQVEQNILADFADAKIVIHQEPHSVVQKELGQNTQTL